ncbi:MAG TPA: type II toxin-antitoxin system VapC family toxin [Bryobacteraceae bacterium]|jgi:ribonuclease VapC|nr:type II toxin-antitoxin system VapC family toxin [Bryobacteraceae bacterium]
MILDSSAIVAVICREPGYEELLWKIADAPTIAIGAPTVAETQMVISIKLGDGGARVGQFLSQIQVLVVPFTRDHVSIFFDAFKRYGKGRHPARLNMGDCFTYAIAKAAGQKVLYFGDDFSQTDLESA